MLLQPHHVDRAIRVAQRQVVAARIEGQADHGPEGVDDAGGAAFSDVEELDPAVEVGHGEVGCVWRPGEGHDFLVGRRGRRGREGPGDLGRLEVPEVRLPQMCDADEALAVRREGQVCDRRRDALGLHQLEGG
jgi:hypothetical protein